MKMDIKTFGNPSTRAVFYKTCYEGLIEID